MKTKPASLARRTYNIYRHQAARAKAAGNPLTYALPALRNKVEWAIGTLRRCRHCATRLTVANFSIDHATPLSRGGGNTYLDIAVICQRCNEIKGALTDAEFDSLLALIHQWKETAGAQDVLRRLRAGGRVRRAT